MNKPPFREELRRFEGSFHLQSNLSFTPSIGLLPAATANPRGPN